MPSAPRFYNNQRPLNPRRPIIAPLGNAPNQGFVSVRSAIKTGNKQLTVQFDGPVDTAGSVPWFWVQVGSATLVEMLTGAGGGTGPSAANWTVHAREATYAEAVLDFADLAGNIDPDNDGWNITGYDSADTSFVARIFNPSQAGRITTP